MFPWLLAHGDLGSADEIIPAVLAFILLVVVLGMVFIDILKQKLGMKHKPIEAKEPVKPNDTVVD